MAFRILGFRPALIPTLVTVPAILLGIGLGVWQVQRLHWKEGLIAERQAAAAAQPLDGLPAAFEPDRHAFRRVQVSGTFLHDLEMYVAARSLRGNAGYHVVTPVRLADGSHLLVNRGWVPLTHKEPPTRAEGQLEGEISLTGFLRATHVQDRFAPDNLPEENFWFWLEVPTMARASGLDRVLPYYLELTADQKPPGTYPLPGQTRIDLPNNHLQYAITWFSVAITAFVIYVLWHRRRERDRRSGDDRA